MKKFMLLLWLGLSATGMYGQAFTPETFQAHINILASDSLEGRGTGTIGEILAANYIAREFRKANLRPVGDHDSYFQHFTLIGTIDGFTHQQVSRNVAGFLDNGAKKTIVIGAHYDHLGKGLQTGSRDPNSVGQIHNGADDNASGTAGLIELARYLSQNELRERYNFLFIAFSAEELGLLGSKYFVENPVIPLESIALMINMDMIGRYDDTRGLTIGGWGTTSWWGRLLPAIVKKENLRYRVDSTGVGASDHTSFYNRKIPVLFFFTGTHNDYHKPVDDADRINAQDAVRILNVIRKLVYALEKESGDPDYRETVNPHAGNTAASFKVTLGVMPDYAYTGKGLKIEGVTGGRPAEKAGLIAGDIIVRIGEYPIKDIYEYMDALGKHEIGQTVEVEYLRGSQSRKTKLTF